MPKIESLVLRCNNPQSQREFYRDVLGMHDQGDGSVGYGGQEARIYFSTSQSSYSPKLNDTYWKIALGVPNIELAYQQLTKRGIQVSQPNQFEDVGFLAKFTDPEGFIIELIDHWFQGERADEQLGSTLLGGGAHLNLLTLRTANIHPITEFCTNCHMKTLSIQPVEKYGFTLYFFAFTVDTPPSPDPLAIENRAWVYQRKYTILEVQHVHGASKMQLPSCDSAAGYSGMVFSEIPADMHSAELLICDKVSQII